MKVYRRKPTSPQKLFVPNRSAFFPIGTLLPNIIMIGLTLGIYYYIRENGILADKQPFIYWIVKIIIAYNIISASARTYVAPILTLLIGVATLVLSTKFDIVLILTSLSWQLIMLAIIGFFVTLTLKH